MMNRHKPAGCTPQYKKPALKKGLSLFLALAITVITFYSLSSPASTQGAPICGKEEHTHTEDCYEPEEEISMECAAQSTVHVHNNSCYDQSLLSCGAAAYFLHDHDDFCYDSQENLICQLNQIEAQEDSDHFHDSSCFDESGWLVCPLPSASEHEHTIYCYENGLLICGRLELARHQHTQDCLNIQQVSALVCTLEEHTHEESCYETKEDTEDTETTTADEQDMPLEDIEEESQTSQTASAAIQSMEELKSNPFSIWGELYSRSTTSRRKAAAAAAAANEEQSGQSQDILYVDPYVTALTLYYYDTNTSSWLEADETTPIPGNTKIRLAISFDGVPVSELVTRQGRLYLTVPQWMKNPVANGVIVIDKENRGTITIDDHLVCYDIDTDWLIEYYDSMNDPTLSLKGDFHVESTLDLPLIDGQVNVIQIGTIEKRINFPENLVEQYGAVDISKSLGSISKTKIVEIDGHNYLQYTLKITAGDDGAKNVIVKDSFVTNGAYVLQYWGVTTTETTTENNTDQAVAPVEGHPNDSTLGYGTVYVDHEGANPTLYWNVGSMKPNEVRTLTYCIQIRDDYTGDATRGVLKNQATVKPDTPVEKSSIVTFTPSAMVWPRKSLYSTTTNADGTITIKYKMEVIANAVNGTSNTYILRDVYIKDGFNLENGYKTEARYLPYITINMDSFTGEFAQAPVYDESIKGFTINMGDLSPGQTKTFYFTITVDPGVYAVSGTDDVKIFNRAWTVSTNQQTGKQFTWNKWQNIQNLSKKTWERKTTPALIEQSSRQDMAGAVFAQSEDGTYSLENTDSFTIKKGYYQYQVVLNEKGDWDLSQSVITDTLTGQIAYAGYLHIQVYDSKAAASSASLTTTAQALALLQSLSPVSEAWLNLQDKTAFSFTPSDLGLPKGSYAYILTYYANPNLPEGTPVASVSNTVQLSGSAGYNGKAYALTPSSVKVTSTVQGDSYLQVSKEGWYYQQPVEDDDYTNGRLYWICKIESSQGITAWRFFIKDEVVSSPRHTLNSDSVVSMWIASSDPTLKIGKEIDYTQFLLDNEQTGEYTSVSLDTIQTPSTNNRTVGGIRFVQDIDFDETQALYIIFCTGPGTGTLPTASRGYTTYKNTIYSATTTTPVSNADNVDWVEWNTASLAALPGSKLFKELGAVFEMHEGKFTRQQGSRTTQTTGLTIDGQTVTLANGTYVDWTIQANHEGNLSGTFYLIDQLPEGVELAYLAMSWAGPGYNSQTDKPKTVEIDGLDDTWTKHVVISSSENASATGSSVTTIYYTNGQQILFKLANVITHETNDMAAVQFQAVCRITDPEVLQGSQIKTFTNYAEIQDVSRRVLSSDTHSVEITVPTIFKNGLYTTDNGAVYPFEILLNKQAAILDPDNSGHLVVIDKIEEPLKVDMNSISAVNVHTGQEVTIQVSVQNGNLRIVVPDGQYIRITYNAKVYAAPNQAVTIDNVAYWEGYPPEDNSTVQESEFVYENAGSGTLTSHPTLTILKMDGDDITGDKLSGAVFDIYTADLDENGNPHMDDKVNTLTTNEQGEAVFNKLANGNSLDFDTIYAVVEVQAPEGYALDSTPTYYAFAHADPDTGEYAFYPDSVRVVYDEANLTAEILNFKGRVLVEKSFADLKGNSTWIAGTYTFGIYDKENPSQSDKPLSTKTMKVRKNGSGNTLEFTGLDMETSYWIYELDDNGQPMLAGQSQLVSRRAYKVSYQIDGASGNEIVFTDETTSTTLSVTNAVDYAILPATGGKGTQIIYTAGWILMMAAMALWLVCKKKGFYQKGEEYEPPN